MSEARVLLVDDEEEYLEAMAERMKTRDLDVTVAVSGSQALELAAEQSFDVVMLDIQMPGIDGIETLRRLHERNPDLEVILISGFGTIEKVVTSMKMGAKDFVQKPADIEELVARARKAHARRLVMLEARQEEAIRKILVERGW